MSSRPKSRDSRALLGARRRRSAGLCRGRRSFNGGRRDCTRVLEKLKTLQNLIPAHDHDGDLMMKPDRIFQETADYILLLRTRILVLQKLIEVFGSSSENGEIVG